MLCNGKYDVLDEQLEIDSRKKLRDRVFGAHEARLLCFRNFENGPKISKFPGRQRSTRILNLMINFLKLIFEYQLPHRRYSCCVAKVLFRYHVQRHFM